MREEPQSNTLELTQPVRFSLGAGTKITSVNVKLDSIRLRDMPSKDYDKRKWATETAEAMAREMHANTFGTEPDGEGEPISYLVVHKPDSVTFEIWKQGPERRTVKLI